MSDDLPAWLVLLAQLAACGTAYVAALCVFDRAPLLMVWHGAASLRARLRS